MSSSSRVEPVWSLTLGHSPRSLGLAREAELLLARDDRETVTLFTTRGAIQSSARVPGLVAACISDDGSTMAAVGSTGQVWWLTPDMRPRLERSIGAHAVAVAADSFGSYLAVSDRQSQLHLFDRSGQAIGRFQSPRPIYHLFFVPTEAKLVAASDFGWAGALELTTGHWTWSDRPVSNIGALAVAGSGDPAILACFSIGMRRYGAAGFRDTTAMPRPCGLVALAFDATRGIACGVTPELFAFDARGQANVTLALDKAPVAIAIAALGDRAFCAFADGTARCYDLPA